MDESVITVREEKLQGPPHGRSTPTKRDLLWEGGTFWFGIPKRLRMRSGSYVGHPYMFVRYNPRVHDSLATTFLHQGQQDLKELQQKAKFVCCTVKVWCNTYEDGQRQFFLDYTPVDSEKATRVLRVVRFADSGELPKGMGGTIISISLPKQKGFILIGDKL